VKTIIPSLFLDVIGSDILLIRKIEKNDEIFLF